MKWLLLFEAAAFTTAALTHFGIIPLGLDDPAAGTAESIIAAVVAAGAAVITASPPLTRRVALAVQAFALAGTFVGLYIFVTVDPEKVADIVYHVVMVVILVTGLVIAARWRQPASIV